VIGNNPLYQAPTKAPDFVGTTGRAWVINKLPETAILKDIEEWHFHGLLVEHHDPIFDPFLFLVLADPIIDLQGVQFLPPNVNAASAGVFRVLALDPMPPMSNVDDWSGCQALVPAQVKMGFFSNKVDDLGAPFLLKLAVSCTKSMINGLISPIGNRQTVQDWHDVVFGVINLNFRGELSSTVLPSDHGVKGGTIN